MGTVRRTQEQERIRQSRSPGRRTAPGRRHGGKASLGPAERRRLLQLVTCLALFLAVFIGKGIVPARMEGVRTQLLSVIRRDTDFQAAFSALGQAVSEGEPVSEALGVLWDGLLGEDTGAASEPALYAAQAAVLCGLRQAPEWPEGLWTDAMALVAGVRLPAEPSVPPEPEPTPVPTPEPAVEHVEYDGPTLPDNTTMDKYNLSAVGVEETVTPVLGWVSSGFGWREHPVDGEEKFHNGVDLAVNNGTEVRAFAAGTVDYIGDSPEYGLYLQLSHAGGLKTFYCHCSRLCVQQGQSVAAGEKVAESGDTGNVTGPHLHFEMKLNGVRLNPVYYIETQ
ncbi:M23 family metallopeptidase [uncultured Flavonifractor sp.]|uniref:M23 family metallopeptidase n=1 Tax=uncultured Flavonifractor sp. TaxID=1193534 RepID=UPI0026338D85|nr:M23 family metallopeptidase [uncultured Flavonifractor sp.]